MKLRNEVGIVAMGTYIPVKRSRVKQLGVFSKSIPAVDEDTITLAVEALSECMYEVGPEIRPKIGALFIGSESHPYAVKPSGTVVARALGLPESIAMADLQFACKAGMQAILLAVSYVAGGMARYGIGIGADLAKATPGDILELTTGAGAAAFIIGRNNIKYRLLASTSIATDTPDFWRRPEEENPSHAGRFTGNPGYFYHVKQATKLLLKETGYKPGDFRYAVFHTPNAKFPINVAKDLGFSIDQLEHSLIVTEIGNTYAGAVPIALVNTLEKTEQGDLVLATSYGSGAGADATIWKTI